MRKDYETLKYEIKDNIITIWLNRPKVHNAFNDTMLTELVDILDDIRADLSIGKYNVEAKWGDSQMVKLCDEYSLDIFPSGEEDHIAECMCPTGRSHRIGINLESGSWFCGYCRISGHVEELRGYLIKYKSL